MQYLFDFKVPYADTLYRRFRKNATCPDDQFAKTQAELLLRTEKFSVPCDTSRIPFRHQDILAESVKVYRLISELKS